MVGRGLAPGVVELFMFSAGSRPRPTVISMGIGLSLQTPIIEEFSNILSPKSIDNVTLIC